jgi:hypothetical protein
MKYLKKFGKKIKSFNSFMKLLKENSYWSEDITEDDFYDYLRDLVDERFDISVEAGFVDCLNKPKEKEGDPNQLELFPLDSFNVESELVGDAESFKDKDEYIVYTGLICPAYKINIEESDSSEGNFTEALMFFKRIVLSELGFQTAILVDDELVDFKYIKVEDGQFHVRMYDDEELGYNTYDSIDLIVMSTEPIDFRIKDVAEYYGWKRYELDDTGDLYFEASIDDMARLICYESSQESIISNGSLDLDFYDGYYPDTDSLIRYYLNGVSKEMLAKCVIRELGGIENIDMLKHISEDEEIKEDEKLQSAIDFLTNNDDDFVNLAEKSDVCDELRGIYSRFSVEAQEVSNYNSLFNEFEEVMDKYFKYKYDPEEREYKIRFEEEWMQLLVNEHSVESDFFRNQDPYDIMYEWFREENNEESLSPRYSEADVNNNKFSEEAIDYMEGYLSQL